MTAKPITIGNRSFPSLAAARRAISPILYRYAPNVPITGEDEELVRALVYMNPGAAEKLGGHAIAHFEVAKRPEQYKKSRSFILVRSDGHRNDFSFYKAL